MREIGAGLATGAPIEVWFQDEMRVGQKGMLTWVWAEAGSRPSAPRSDGYQSVYLSSSAPCARTATWAAP